MAEIEVQRRGPTVWPWVIGLIVLALLIWALTEVLGDEEPEVPVQEPAAGSVQPTP